MTAAILIPIVFISILYLETSVFKWPLAIVTALAAIEWFTIIGLNSWKKKSIGFIALLVLTIVAINLRVISISVFSISVWSAVFIFVVCYSNRPLTNRVTFLLSNEVISTCITAVILTLFWVSAIQLHQFSALGPQQLLYAMVLVWLADTGGYFAGKRFGKRKLAKEISPNKTWEGVAGALILGSLWIVISFVVGISGTISLLAWSVLSLVTLSISIIGDLFESVFKRLFNVKDSGNLLPGHGGILDRIDSLLAAIPVFAAGIYFLGV